MKTTLVITDLTRMSKPRVCLAGYDSAFTCIRPVLGRVGITEDWLRVESGMVVRPFARVELDLLRHCPDPPHTEDWWASRYVKRCLGLLDENERLQMLDGIADVNVASIFGTEILTGPGWYVLHGQGKRSLGTVLVQTVRGVIFRQSPYSQGTWEYKLTFTDGAGQEYQLSVTDLAFRYYLDSKRNGGKAPGATADELCNYLRQAEVWLRIGLARRWCKYPERCYLQVTGVYSFPDYLGGKCFADLA